MYQSVVDAYVNCEKIGRKITRSVLDLFAYKKKFKPNKVEFRIAQRGYNRAVHSRYLVSLEGRSETILLGVYANSIFPGYFSKFD